MSENTYTYTFTEEQALEAIDAIADRRDALLEIDMEDMEEEFMEHIAKSARVLTEVLALMDEWKMR